MANNRSKISTLTLLVYALPAIPLAALGLPLYVHLPAVYAALLTPALVGLVLFSARSLDVVTDPVVGWLSDRLPSPHMRRRLTIVCGLPLLLVGIDQLMRPTAVSVAQLAIWTTLIYVGWTMVILPYMAWGAELARDYQERTRVTLWREGAIILGTVIAVVLPVAMNVGNNPRASLELLATYLLWTLPPALLLTCLFVPERPPSSIPKTRLLAGIIRCVKNRLAMRLLFAHLLNSFANALPATLFFFYVGSVLGEPKRAGMLLLIYFCAAIIALPAWWVACQHFAKHSVWAVSMVWAACVFSFALTLGQGDWIWFAWVCVFSGISLGADMALPASIQADIVQHDGEVNHEQRAGAWFGLWSMVTKLSLALAAGLALPMLQWSGFDTTSSQSSSGISVLIFLYAGAPVLLKLPAAWLVWKFPDLGAR